MISTVNTIECCGVSISLQINKALYLVECKMVDMNTGQNETTALDEESLLKFCDLLKKHQLLAANELEILQDDSILLLEKISKLRTVFSDQLGFDNHPIDVILNYNENQLLEAWNDRRPLALVRKELRKYYTAIGNQPDKDTGWLWSEQTFPMGRMHVVRMDSEKTDTKHFSVEEVNRLATASKWRILVLGAPGIGKTSFVWKLTKEWAKGRILEFFLAVFYIDIYTNSRLADVLDMLLGEMKDLQTKIQSSRKVLFILDGWNDKSGARWDLIVSSKFPQASIVITAQTTFLPWLSTAKWDHVYKVKGLLGYYQTTEKIKHYEILTEKEARSLLSQPMVEDTTIKFLQQGNNGKTIAKLVHEIIRGITKRHLLCYNKKENRFTVELPECLTNECFIKLCKMAFHNMSGGCSIRVNSTEKCYTFGLVDILHTVGGSTLYTFNHKVIQSFLAAIFMTQLDKEALKLNLGNQEFRLLWYFHGYLTSERQHTLSTQHYTSSISYYLLGTSNPSTILTNVLPSTEINFKDEKVDPSCLYSVGQMMASSNARWSLSVIRCDIYPKGLALLLKSLQSAAENVSINKLVVQDVSTPTHMLLELAREQPILEELTIQHKHPSPNFISFTRNDILLSILSQQRDNLHILSLVNVSLGLDGAQQIANGLQPDTKQCTHALKQITLKRNNLGPTGTEVLARTLQSCKRLTKLCISYNDVRDTGAYAIADYIGYTKVLEALAVVDDTLTVKGSRTIAEALKENTTIIDVTLHRASTGRLGHSESVELTMQEVSELRHKIGYKDVKLHYNE